MARSYRLPDGSRLIEMGLPSAMYLTLDEHGRTAMTDGETIEPRLYDHVAPDGSTIATYGTPRTYALDDYFYILELCYIRGDTLYRCGIELGGAGGTFRCTLMRPEERCLEGLVPTAPDERSRTAP